MLSIKEKEYLQNEIVRLLSKDKEIQKIILFGSFLNSEDPGDIDIAIVQNSNENYLTLAMKYRKQMRDISKQLPLDVIPVKAQTGTGPFSQMIRSGKVIYEKRN